jgi:hypothetical protein
MVDKQGRGRSGEAPGKLCRVQTDGASQVSERWVRSGKASQVGNVGFGLMRKT